MEKEEKVAACDKSRPTTRESGGYQSGNNNLRNGYDEQDKLYPRLGCFRRVIAIIAVLH